MDHGSEELVFEAPFSETSPPDLSGTTSSSNSNKSQKKKKKRKSASSRTSSRSKVSGSSSSNNNGNKRSSQVDHDRSKAKTRTSEGNRLNDNHGSSYEERMRRKMTEFDKPSESQRAPKVADQVEAPRPAGETLEERMARKMAQDEAARKPKHLAETQELSYAEKMRRKMAEFDKPAPSSSSSGPQMAAFVDAPKPGGESLEERMARKMAADDATRSSISKNGVGGGTALQDQVRRKIAEFDNNRHTTAGQARPASISPNVEPRTGSETLEQRMARKMAEDEAQRNGTASRPGAYYETKDGTSSNRKQTPLRLDQGRDAPSPSISDRMERKLSASKIASSNTTNRPGAYHSSGNNSPKDRKVAPTYSTHRDAPNPPTMSTDARLDRKMAADRATREHSVRSRDSRDMDSYVSRNSIEDRIQRKMSVGSIGNNDRRIGTRTSQSLRDMERKMQAYGGDAYDDDVYEHRLADLPSEGSISVPSDIEADRRASARSAAASSIHSGNGSGQRLHPSSSVSKAGMSRLGSSSNRSGESRESAPGAYQVEGRAIGPIPAWGRQLRRSFRNQRRRAPGTSRREFTPFMDNRDRRIPPAGALQGALSAPMLGQSNQGEDRGAYLQDEDLDVGASGLPNDYDMEQYALEGRREKGISQRTLLIIIFGVIAVMAVSIGVGVGLALRGDGSGGDATKSMAPTAPPALGPSPFPTPSPTFESCDEMKIGSFPQIITSCACKNTIEWGDTNTNDLFAFCLDFRSDLEFRLGTRFASQCQNILVSCEIDDLAFAWLVNDTLTTRIRDTSRLANRLFLVHLMLTWSEGQPGRWGVPEGSWLAPSDECNWIDVECSATNEVVGLYLRDFDTAPGTGWAPSLFELRSLRTLELDGLTAPNIPADISSLVFLERLSIRNHRIRRNLPNGLFSLTRLTSLEIMADNDDTYSGELEGVMPTLVGNLVNLERFFFTKSQLGGPLPIELGRLTRLRELGLADNQFNRNIPQSLGALTSLTAVDLGMNQLSGPIPPQMVQLPLLQRVNIYGNKLTGTIPSGLAKASLVCVEARDNRLSGRLDDGVCNSNPTIYVDRGGVSCSCCRTNENLERTCLV